MGRERRKHPRLKFEVPVNIKSGHYLFAARTADISEGGVFIKTPAPIKAGATIHLHLKLDDHQTITVVGTVAWPRQDDEGRQIGVGVQFEEMSPYARSVLKGYMRTHTTDFYRGPKKVAEPPRPRRVQAEVYRIPHT